MTQKKHSFWDPLSMMEGGHLKSTFLMYSFALSLLFLAAAAVFYLALIDPIEAAFAAAPVWLRGALESLVPALATALFAALCQRLARDKRLAAAAFLWLLLYAALLLVGMLSSLDAGDRGAFMQLYVQTVPAPLLFGGALTALGLRRMPRGKHERG